MSHKALLELLCSPHFTGLTVSDFVFMGFLCFYYFSCLFCPVHFILFIVIIVLLFWMPVCFLIRETDGVDLGGWGSGEDLEKMRRNYN